MSERAIPDHLRFILGSYAQGVFPMGEDDGTVGWYRPHKRGIIPLDAYTPPQSMRKYARKHNYAITMNYDFDAVVWGCASADIQGDNGVRSETWITEPIQDWYADLRQYGFAHSFEVWQGTALIGGLYGVSLGGLFAGESMFSRRPNASKFALWGLVEWLRSSGYVLLDTQFYTDHLSQFGCIEISQEAYEERLRKALTIRPNHRN